MRFWIDSHLFPEQASTMAPQVDALYLFLIGLTAVLTFAIFTTLIYFAVKYRRRRPDDVGADIRGVLLVETLWIAGPLVIVLGIFLWSSQLFIAIADVPDDTLDVYVVARQWMWKIQHANGRREINALHVPTGRDVRLILTSQDVIHDFFVPAFRIKTDVLPGRYTSLWFNATKPGRYHLFCAEYCGTLHSGMLGDIVVLTPRDYAAWLAEGGASEGALASTGQALFQNLACAGCHEEGQPTMRGPTLRNLFGSRVQLQGDEQIIADESYIRESILNPRAKIVRGFDPLMPAFQGLLSEDELAQLIEYIKSLSAPLGGPS